MAWDALLLRYPSHLNPADTRVTEKAMESPVIPTKAGIQWCANWIPGQARNDEVFTSIFSTRPTT